MTRDRVANLLDDTTRMAPAQAPGADAQPAGACLVVLVMPDLVMPEYAQFDLETNYYAIKTGEDVIA